MRIFTLTTCLLLAASASADTLHTSDTHVRASLPGQKNTAAFASWHNAGKEILTLTSLSSPAAAKVELHTHTQNNGQMQMREVKDFTLKPGQHVAMQQANLHLMLIDMPQALKEGDSITITSCFNDTLCTDAQFTAISIHNENKAPAHHHHHH